MSTNQPPKDGFVTEFVTGFLSVLQGMGVTLKNLVLREKITVQYPYERVTVSPRYRGLFYLPFDEEAGKLKCVGCTLCAQACPTNVITMNKVVAGKNSGVDEFTMDLGRCMFCDLCIEACPFEAIFMGPEYELASSKRNVSLFRIEDLAKGGKAAVERNNATLAAAAQAEAAAKAARAAAAAAAKPAQEDGT